MIKNAIEEIEYQKFKERNKNIISLSKEDDTVLDGLNDKY